ncbi:hypothetical protein VTJ83DRAFT_1388 [Remersonia thermophila]|uniref:Tyrosinase copper-binding domain-containing protein n=1 Tax=Remersonia thermophila TaxID=72144 RepID=A0ABR4DNW5_9PEZI
MSKSMAGGEGGEGGLLDFGVPAGGVEPTWPWAINRGLSFSFLLKPPTARHQLLPRVQPSNLVDMTSVKTLLSLFALLAVTWAGPVERRKWEFKPNPNYPPDAVDMLLVATMPKVAVWVARRAGSTNNCTLENAAVRKEWSDLTPDERREYIRAVLCLQSKPSLVPEGQVPGALSRFDDFVATHMILTATLHSEPNLLAAHRYYIWAYEKALREECGYTGYQPYMNYERYADDPIHSPLFDGSDTSLGGNGEPHEYPGIYTPFPAPYDLIPPAGGGGCVTTGPFKDMVVSLGPGSTVVQDIPPNPRRDGLGSNPRCLRRDVNKFSAAGARVNYTLSTIVDNPTIDGFYGRYLGQPLLEGDPYPWGIHIAGHYIIGGDPGGDFYASPGDPAFYLHHAMLDRVWWIWQMQDPDNRVNAVPGYGNVAPPPPGGHGGHGGHKKQKRQSIWDEVVDLGWTAPPAKLMDLNEQLGGLGGEFCYVYA